VHACAVRVTNVARQSLAKEPCRTESVDRLTDGDQGKAVVITLLSGIRHDL
jgi:hypothetical protein